MIKFLVICTFVNPAYKPKYRLFTTETKAVAFMAMQPPTTTTHLELLREDEE